MPVLGITGGIATGKSTFSKTLLGYLPGAFFDADASAHALLAGDPGVATAVRAAFGEAALDAAGRPDRTRLREIIFHAPTRRAELEGILHPLIREQWTQMAAAARLASGWLYVDIPLLYETDTHGQCDRVVVVACSPATQRARLRGLRGLDEAISEKIIGAQHDLGFKIQKADHLIWNDSTVSCLDAQVKLFAGWLRNYHV